MSRLALESNAIGFMTSCFLTLKPFLNRTKKKPKQFLRPVEIGQSFGLVVSLIS